MKNGELFAVFKFLNALLDKCALLFKAANKVEQLYNYYPRLLHPELWLIRTLIETLTNGCDYSFLSTAVYSLRFMDAKYLQTLFTCLVITTD